MSAVMDRARIAVRREPRHGPARGPALPRGVRVACAGWLAAFGAVALAMAFLGPAAPGPAAALSASSSAVGLLVASTWREGGRVLACRYFTGARTVERQHAVAAGGAEPQAACPLFARVG